MPITLRNEKGSELTFEELDDNFITLYDLCGGVTPPLSDVLAAGNTTGVNNISINQDQKIFNAYDNKGTNFENRIEFGGYSGDYKIISENVDADTAGNEAHQTIINLSSGEVGFRAEIKGDGDTIPSVAGDLRLGWLAVEGQNEPIVSMVVNHLLIGGPHPYDEIVKVSIILPTSSSGLTQNQLWNDNGTVKIVL